MYLTLEVVMSDGPHRSLPRRPSWKKVAARSDKKTYSADDIKEALVCALRDDWSKEAAGPLINGLRNLLESGQSDLFVDPLQQLRSLRNESAGLALGCDIVDATELALRQGIRGLDALEEGAFKALLGRSLSSERQIEEHYRREATSSRAINVRDRLHEAIDIAPLRGLARSLLGLDSSFVPRHAPKHGGLDDGVPML